MDSNGLAEGERVRVHKGVKWERGVGGSTLREKVLGFVWTNWLLYRIGRAGYFKKKIIINYIIYFKYMGKLDRVWRVWNFITQTQPNPL